MASSRDAYDADRLGLSYLFSDLTPIDPDADVTALSWGELTALTNDEFGVTYTLCPHCGQDHPDELTLKVERRPSRCLWHCHYCRRHGETLNPLCHEPSPDEREFEKLQRANKKAANKERALAL